MSRLYFFNNMYLSSIQNGIQAGHAAVELMLKYQKNDGNSQSELVHDWAENHKTFVVLNGGGTPLMHEIRAHLESPFNSLPWAQFIEPDLDGALTSLAVLLPERLYVPDENGVFEVSDMWEHEFVVLKNKCRLAS